MPIHLKIVPVALLALAVFQTQAKSLRTIGEIREACKSPENLGQSFDVVGRVRSYQTHTDLSLGYVIQSEDGFLDFYEWLSVKRTTPSDGHFGLLDQIHLRGHLYPFKGRVYPKFESSERIRCGNPDELPQVTSAELASGRLADELVRVVGTVRTAELDDSDANYIHLSVKDDSGAAQVMIRTDVGRPVFDPGRYLGATVSVAGIPTLLRAGARQHAGHVLTVSTCADIRIRRPPATLENAPDIETLARLLPQEIATCGLHRADGLVLARWGGDSFLLQTVRGRIVQVRLRKGSLPPCGEGVRVLGLPTTDTYQINLLQAGWSPADSLPTVTNQPMHITLASLLTNEKGAPQLMVQHHGKLICLSGCVRYLSSERSSNAHFQIESDGRLVPIDVSALPASLERLELGCEVSITGICVMNAANWMDELGGDRRAFQLVPRSAEDIAILSRPPWWTPRRLMTLLGILIATLLGVIGWNVSLNRHAKAKGRELAAEQLAHVTSELKVNERTRLAVELHDALSQTLTGVSMQIDTAAGFAKGKIPAVSKCLAIASRTIDACRMELRNTLWDLRSAALDEPIMDAAIRKTLCQNLAGIDLSVRFNVPRETFSDNTAHAVLRIIRELATNALRHGKATSLKIAGAIDDGNLLFSVRDNGCGFDPDLAPGIAQGHFGLQGVAERLERLNGEMKIESSPGKGAKVTVILPIPRSGE